LTGDFAAVLPAHPIGYNRYRAMAASLFFLGWLPKTDKVFVIAADRTWGR
jgi:hypothetical protein